jgi:hypothetical protein
MLHLIAFGIAVLFFITCGLLAIYYTLEAILPPLFRAVGATFRFAYACIPFAIIAVAIWVGVRLLLAGKLL